MSEQIEIVQSNIVENMTEDLFALLRRVPILASLKSEELHCLEGVQEVHVGAEEAIAPQGEVAHFFWILLEGELRVFYTQPDGGRMVLAKIESGNAFGELSLLANIPNAATTETTMPCHLLQLDEDHFWHLMTTCPEVRRAILGNMAYRFQKLQSVTVQQEKMASLGTLAAGLMHELNNPGSAARRASSQLRDNLLRLHRLSARFSEMEVSKEQKIRMYQLQKEALDVKQPLRMNSLEQSDAEEALAEWMESANIQDAWKMAPTLVSVGMDAAMLEDVREEFSGPLLEVTLGWLEALVSSMQLVGTIEESIGRVTDLVHAVKSYAYESRGQKQTIDVNDSIHATLVILAHKLREKEIVLQKDFAADLPMLQCECTGLNQIWTNLLDNAIDAVGQHGHLGIRTWAEKMTATSGESRTDLCIRVEDNGSGIPLDSQPLIFDPFYTTKAAGVGTGIGLGIVQRIVDQYGGTIRFASEPGHTEFVVRLPAEHS